MCRLLSLFTTRRNDIGDRDDAINVMKYGNDRARNQLSTTCHQRGRFCRNWTTGFYVWPAMQRYYPLVVVRWQ
jgi:hypothetical protein